MSEEQQCGRRRLRAAAAASYLLALYASLAVARPAAEWLRSQGLLSIFVLVLLVPAVPAVLAWRCSTVGTRRMMLRAGLVAMLLSAAFLLPSTPEERLHFPAYGLLGWLIGWSLEEEEKQLSLPLLCLLVWLAGTVDELIQAVLPTRIFDFRDILFNGLAGTAGVLVFATGQAKTPPALPPGQHTNSSCPS